MVTAGRGPVAVAVVANVGIGGTSSFLFATDMCGGVAFCHRNRIFLHRDEDRNSM